MTLYVPVGTSATYKADAEWSKFTNVVEYYPETIETFTATTDDQIEMTFKILDHYHFKAQVGDGIGCAIGSETSSLVIIIVSISLSVTFHHCFMVGLPCSSFTSPQASTQQAPELMR